MIYVNLEYNNHQLKKKIKKKKILKSEISSNNYTQIESISDWIPNFFKDDNENEIIKIIEIICYFYSLKLYNTFDIYNKLKNNKEINLEGLPEFILQKIEYEYEIITNNGHKLKLNYDNLKKNHNKSINTNKLININNSELNKLYKFPDLDRVLDILKLSDYYSFLINPPPDERELSSLYEIYKFYKGDHQQFIDYINKYGIDKKPPKIVNSDDSLDSVNSNNIYGPVLVDNKPYYIQKPYILNKNDESIITNLFKVLKKYIKTIEHMETSNIKPYWDKTKINKWIQVHISTIDNITDLEIQKLKNVNLDSLMVDDIKNIITNVKKRKQIVNKLFNSSSKEMYLRMYDNEMLEIQNISEDYSNYRIFFIGGHGYSCSLDSIKKKTSKLKAMKNMVPSKLTSKRKFKREKAILRDRLSFKNTFKEFMKTQNYEHQPNHKNIVLVTTQTFGRVALTRLGTLYMSHMLNNELFFKSLYNANTNKDLNILNQYTTFNYFLNIRWNQQYPESDTQKYKPNIIKHFKNFKTYDHPSRYITTSKYSEEELTNYMKYNTYNLSENFKISFNPQRIQDLTGIFELSSPYKENLPKLIHTINNHKLPVTIDTQLGIESWLEPLYFEAGINKPSFTDLLKYNLFLKNNQPPPLITKKGPLIKPYFSLDEVLKTIYAVGNIKPHEKVLIISNQCRGISHPSVYGNFNTIQAINDTHSKGEAEALRTKSYNKMLKSFKPPLV